MKSATCPHCGKVSTDDMGNWKAGCSHVRGRHIYGDGVIKEDDKVSFLFVAELHSWVTAKDVID